MAADGRAGDAVGRAREELGRRLGRGEVLDDPLALALYSRDASMIEGACALVSFSRDREQVVACLQIAERHGLALVPRGRLTEVLARIYEISERHDLIVVNMFHAGAAAVVVGNPGCAMQIAAGLAALGSATGALHPAELLDQAYGSADR